MLFRLSLFFVYIAIWVGHTGTSICGRDGIQQKNPCEHPGVCIRLFYTLFMIADVAGYFLLIPEKVGQRIYIWCTYLTL